MHQQSSTFTPFPPGWFSFSLWSFRPCEATYQLFPYDSIPPIPEDALSGTLQWLNPLDEDIDHEMQPYRHQEDEEFWSESLHRLAASAQRLGLRLPEPFVRFMASQELRDRIPSCTACYFDLPEKIVHCPGTEDGYVFRFLNDQQFVLLWYLYLNPRGEHCVLVTHPRFHDLAESPDYAEPFQNEEERQEVLKGVYVCAPSFAAFLYRFWLENTIWFNFDLHKPLTEEQRSYLSHYKPVAPNAHLLENKQ
jgi:hypothetical protein